MKLITIPCLLITFMCKGQSEIFPGANFIKINGVSFHEAIAQILDNNYPQDKIDNAYKTFISSPIALKSSNGNIVFKVTGNFIDTSVTIVAWYVSHGTFGDKVSYPNKKEFNKEVFEQVSEPFLIIDRVAHLFIETQVYYYKL